MLPCTFDNFTYSNQFYSKSTCIINSRSNSSYEFVTNFSYQNDGNKSLDSLCLQFPNLRHLEINLPFNDNLWSIIPKHDRLLSLHIKISDQNIRYTQLQELFNRATHLYLLIIGIDGWILLESDLFALSSQSIRYIRFVRKARLTLQYLNEREFDVLMNSSIARYCHVLAFGVQNRRKILCLVNTMFNLQSLIIQCEDDTLNCIDSSSVSDELVEWLDTNLPSTCSITRDIGTSNIPLWIER